MTSFEQLTGNDFPFRPVQIGLPVNELPPEYTFTDEVDLKELAVLLAVCFPDERTSSADIGIERARRMQYDDTIIDVGVTYADALIGYGRVVYDYSKSNGNLTDFAVHKAHRRQGIGKAIIDRRVERADAAQVKRLYIPRLQHTNKLESYYIERHGFAPDRNGSYQRFMDAVLTPASRPFIVS